MALPIANTAKYELTLPSQQKKVEYRPFLVKEEKILLLALESGKPEEMLKAVQEIVKSCTFGTMNPEEYPMFDLEYVFLQIRAKSVGEIAKLKVLCPDDKKTYGEIEVDLTKIEVFVDDDHTNNIVLDENRKLGVILKYPGLKNLTGSMLGGNTIKMSDSYKLVESLIDQVYEGENITFAKDAGKDEMKAFVESLSSEQVKKLMKFFESAPRLEHKVKVTNPNTKVEREITLRGLSDFFG